MSVIDERAYLKMERALTALLNSGIKGEDFRQIVIFLLKSVPTNETFKPNFAIFLDTVPLNARGGRHIGGLHHKLAKWAAALRRAKRRGEVSDCKVRIMNMGRFVWDVPRKTKPKA